MDKRKWRSFALILIFVFAWAVCFGCAVYRLLGVPCPGCGMTRAWLQALRLDFAGAFRILRSLGYSGPFLLEMWSGTAPDDRAEIARSRALLEEAYERSLRP